MSAKIPLPAAYLLSFIYETETGRTVPQCYEVLFGHRQTALKKPLTTMTVEEVLAAQKTWATKKWASKFNSTKASSAAGAAQIIRKTLLALVKQLNLSGSELFDKSLQDRLAFELLKSRGYESFVSGKISLNQFALNLAKEWASMPVLEKTQGSSRVVTRGQSYYAGDGLNSARVTAAKLEEVLRIVKDYREETPTAVAPGKVPDPSSFPGDDLPETPEKRSQIALIWAGIIGALVAFWAWIVSLPCTVLGVLCGG